MIINEIKHKEHHARSPEVKSQSLTIHRVAVTAGTGTTLVQFTDFCAWLQANDLPVTFEGIHVQRNDDKEATGVSIRLQVILLNKLLVC